MVKARYFFRKQVAKRAVFFYHDAMQQNLGNISLVLVVLLTEALAL